MLGFKVNAFLMNRKPPAKSLQSFTIRIIEQSFGKKQMFGNGGMLTHFVWCVGSCFPNAPIIHNALGAKESKPFAERFKIVDFYLSLFVFFKFAPRGHRGVSLASNS